MRRLFLPLAVLFVSTTILLSGCSKAPDKNPRITDPNVPELQPVGVGVNPNPVNPNPANPNPANPTPAPAAQQFNDPNAVAPAPVVTTQKAD